MDSDHRQRERCVAQRDGKVRLRWINLERENATRQKTRRDLWNEGTIQAKSIPSPAGQRAARLRAEVGCICLFIGEIRKIREDNLNGSTKPGYQITADACDASDHPMLPRIQPRNR